MSRGKNLTRRKKVLRTLVNNSVVDKALKEVYDKLDELQDPIVADESPIISREISVGGTILTTNNNGEHVLGVKTREGWMVDINSKLVPMMKRFQPSLGLKSNSNRTINNEALLYDSLGNINIHNNLKVNKHAYFDTAQTIVNTPNIEIDWGLGNKAHVTLTDSLYNVITFTGNPNGPCNLILKIKQNNGADTISSWSASSGTIKWASSTVPTLSTGSAEEDIVSFYYDGANYYGMIALDFG